ncbi:MAG: class I SAM-dependent methyltransferase [Armatimonadetes bacterium]|nr:class I SAM-dependent methyltransferase [Armatimonadota bacterium]
MDLETVDCPICETDDTVELGHVRDLNLLRPGEFRLVRCRRCGLAYVNPRPTLQAIGDYYTADYWVDTQRCCDESALGSSLRETLRWLSRHRPGGRVLDVGCGAGHQAAALTRHGFCVLGLDPHEGACRVARELNGVDTVCATLAEADLPSESFDAVTFSSVLEHVHDPLQDLRRVLELLKPGGLVAIRAPNIGSWQACLLGRWWFLEIPRHLYHFTPRTLHALLRKAGFVEVSSRAVPSWAFGSAVFEASVLHALRARHLARRGIEVTPTPGGTVGQALDGLVYGAVPSGAKRAFRWIVGRVVYLPLAIENLVGRSVELLGMGWKPRPNGPS